MPNNLEVVSFADDWQSRWNADPEALTIAQWRFADAVHGPLNTAMTRHNPNARALYDGGSAVLRIQKIDELAAEERLAASLLIHTVEDPHVGQRVDIAGIAVATPEVTLVGRQPRRQRWSPVESDLPLVRLEVVATGDAQDRYEGTRMLTKHVTQQADIMYPGGTIATIVPSYNPGLNGYNETMAGLASEVGCLVGNGRYAWGDFLPMAGSLRRPAQVIASRPWLAHPDAVAVPTSSQVS